MPARVSPTEKVRGQIDAHGAREMEITEDFARAGARLIIQTALEQVRRCPRERGRLRERPGGHRSGGGAAPVGGATRPEGVAHKVAYRVLLGIPPFCSAGLRFLLWTVTPFCHPLNT